MYEKNLGVLYDKAIARYGDKPFFQYYDRTITFTQFGQMVDRLANSLKGLGFKKGDFITFLRWGAEVTPDMDGEEYWTVREDVAFITGKVTDNEQ